MQLFIGIRDGRWKKVITTLRTLEYPSDSYNKAKRKLPCVMMSASTATGGHKAADIDNHSGILQIDVDDLTESAAIDLRDRLGSDPHVMAAWLSPSARGVKGALRIPETVEGHLRAFECASTYIRDAYGVEIDQKCKDPCRLCFVSHDPDIKINAECVPLPVGNFHLTQLETIRRKKLKSSTTHPPTFHNSNNSTTSLHPESCILDSAFYVLHNKKRLFGDFPLLERMYMEHVTKRLGTPQRGTRNEALVEIVSWLVYVVHPRFVAAFANAYYCEHPAIFEGYPDVDYERETKCLLDGCLESYPKELSSREATSYSTMLNEAERSTFRICRSLANSDSEPEFPPPFFFLSADNLGARLGMLPMQAWRILNRFEKIGIIQCVQKGTRRAKGQDCRASSYQWLLTEPSDAATDSASP